MLNAAVDSNSYHASFCITETKGRTQGEVCWFNFYNEQVPHFLLVVLLLLTQYIFQIPRLPPLLICCFYVRCILQELVTSSSILLKVVCYLNSCGEDFSGGMFHFQDGEPANYVPMAGVSQSS